jgi:hypothetical protein
MLLLLGLIRAVIPLHFTCTSLHSNLDIHSIPYTPHVGYITTLITANYST